MKKISKKRIGRVLIGILLLRGFIGWIPARCVQGATKSVSDFKELKEAMESTEDQEIEITKDIDLMDGLVVRGVKRVKGNNHILKRSQKEQNVFGGTLFLIEKAQLELEEITISGGGKSDVVQSALYGRLIDIDQGKVVLGKGSILCQNCNLNQNHDGGGAVRIHNKGTLLLEGGIIRENQNVTGGAGVRVERGGSFLMNDGELTQNRSAGIGSVEGFDGRGGAIYSEGKVKICGGKITENRASGYRTNETVYGGVGGAIYSVKNSNFQIYGGVIGNNRAESGDDIYLAGGTCRLYQNPSVQSIYMESGSLIRADSSLSVSDRIEIEPENYRVGICLVTGIKENSFRLKKKGTFILKIQNRRGYLAKRQKKKTLASTPTPLSTPNPTPKGTPEVTPSKTPKENKERNKENEKKRKKKKKSTVQTTQRYFFQWEINSYLQKDWEEELLKKCRIDWGEDHGDSISYQWEWNGLLSNKVGFYRVKLTILQMNPVVIPVHIVEDKVTMTEETSYVRFLDEKETFNDSCEEIWMFSRADMRAVHTYMREQKAPFSRETNQKFLIKFFSCRKKVEDTIGKNK